MMALRLTDLEPEFLVVESPGHWRTVGDISAAQGIEFLCPKCFAANGGPVGTHAVICWSRSRGAPDDESPGPGRWKIEGTGFADLTLNADPPSGARSVQLNGGCGWHGFITNGEATNA
jgi:hypothetical protein